MALTTKNAPEAPQPKPVVSAKAVTEDDVKALYNKGFNHYQIAREVFGFDSEDAIERVRRILGVQYEPETKLLDE